MLERLRPKTSFTRASCLYTFLFIITILYFELCQLWLTSAHWSDDMKNPDATRILLVADPQLIGERNENRLLGFFTRWHSDRYISKNYNMAKYRTNPHIVIFLGDLLDEASIATKDEAIRYVSRFNNVFQLKEFSGKTDNAVYIYVPGDNDVGGEGREQINSKKLHWFNSTFDNLETSIIFETKPKSLNFIKLNFGLKPSLESSLKPETNPDSLNIGLSHFPCMEIFQTCEKLIRNKKPKVLLTSHTHQSAYHQYTENGVPLTYYQSILQSDYKQSKIVTEELLKSQVKLTDKYLEINLKDSSIIHEITIPTCSYRMGVMNIGFGLLEINENQEMIRYKILWLPNGFMPLVIYITFYIVSKIIFAPWIFFKMFQCLCPSFSSKLLRRRTSRTEIPKEKAHLV